MRLAFGAERMTARREARANDDLVPGVYTNSSLLVFSTSLLAMVPWLALLLPSFYFWPIWGHVSRAHGRRSMREAKVPSGACSG